MDWIGRGIGGRGKGGCLAQEEGKGRGRARVLRIVEAYLTKYGCWGAQGWFDSFHFALYICMYLLFYFFRFFVDTINIPHLTLHYTMLHYLPDYLPFSLPFFFTPSLLPPYLLLSPMHACMHGRGKPISSRYLSAPA